MADGLSSMSATMMPRFGELFATTQTQDAKEIVSFMCSKFSGLINRVQAAENKCATAQQQNLLLESDLHNLTNLCSAGNKCQLAKEETAQARVYHKKMVDAQSKVAYLSGELRRSHELCISLEHQSKVLSAQCAAEDQKTLDATDAATRNEEARASHENERMRLRAEVDKLREQLTLYEEELYSNHEIERHRKAKIRTFEDLLANTARERMFAERHLETLREERCGASRKLTSHRERLDAAQHSLLMKQDELGSEERELSLLRSERQRKEREVAAVGNTISQLERSTTAFEEALRKNVGVRKQLENVAELNESFRMENESALFKHEEVTCTSIIVIEQLAEAAESSNRWHRRLMACKDATAKGERAQQLLDNDVRTAENATVELRSECRNAFADTERLCAERDKSRESCEEVQRRLNSVESNLEATRRRARELENMLGDVDADVSRMRNHNEVLLRGVGQCRDKMCSLRRRHLRLTEKAKDMKQQTLRGSRAASFLVATQTLKEKRKKALPPHHVSSPLHYLDSPRTPRAASCNLPPSRFLPLSTTPSSNENLGHLMQWIQLEEARLSMGCEPSEPSPASNVTKQLNLEVLTQPPHSAAALAALQAGATPAEAVVLLETNSQQYREEASVPDLP